MFSVTEAIYFKAALSKIVLGQFSWDRFANGFFIILFFSFVLTIQKVVCKSIHAGQNSILEGAT